MKDILDEKFNEITSKYGNATSQTLGIEIKNGDKREANNIFVTDAKDYVRFTSKEERIHYIRRHWNLCNTKTC